MSKRNGARSKRKSAPFERRSNVLKAPLRRCPLIPPAASAATGALTTVPKACSQVLVAPIGPAVAQISKGFGLGCRSRSAARREAADGRAGERPDAWGRPRGPRLRHLHLGLDRRAQGGDDPPWRARELRPRDAAGPRAHPLRSHAAVRLPLLRRQRRGDLLLPGERRGADPPQRRDARRGSGLPGHLCELGGDRLRPAHRLLARAGRPGRRRRGRLAAIPPPPRLRRRAGAPGTRACAISSAPRRG
jgi:hypothetical protein